MRKSTKNASLHEALRNLWKKSRYFIEEKPTSNKALAQWAYSHFDFRTPDYKRLSENTIIQEFGEVWREMKVAGKI